MLRVRGAKWSGENYDAKSRLGMTLKDSGEIRLLGKSDGDFTAKEDIGVMFDQPYFQDDWTPLDIEKGIRPFYHTWDNGSYRKYLSRFELDSKKKFRTFHGA